MRSSREIVRQKWLLGRAHRAIAESVGASLGVVSKTLLGRTTRSMVLPCRWYLVTESDAPTHVNVRVHGVTWLGAPTP